ncbi:MAG: hypothetical protein IPQ16_04495 [Geobacteraceae bacterium]|nr:hypothetical protein [Geobacteraceae bacterium]
MDFSELRAASSKPPRKQLTLDRKDFPLTVRYGETVYVLVVTKSEKLLLQKPLE